MSPLALCIQTVCPFLYCTCIHTICMYASCVLSYHAHTVCTYVQVSLHRQREVGSITVDRTDVVSGRPAGPYVGLDIAQEVLFLGGLPTGVTPRGILQPGETVGSTLYIASLLCALTACIHCCSFAFQFGDMYIYIDVCVCNKKSLCQACFSSSQLNRVVLV